MNGAPDDKRDFFISFNQADRAWATWIAWVLEEAGYKVLFQDWDFRGSFLEQMHQASLRSARTLVVLSDHYLRSEFARSEAWAALAGDPVGREDRVVTVKVGPAGDLGLFGHFAFLDLTGEAEATTELLLRERVKKSLDPAYRSKPQTRPHFPGHAAAKPAFPPLAAGPALATNNLPPLNPDFVGREDVLTELRRLLTTGQGPAVLTQAITGLGGIGKSQTARAYAYRHLADYELVWWLRAETSVTLAADYAALAEPLGLDPGTTDQAQLIAAIRQQLHARSDWLLVFDNVEAPALPQAWLPGTGGGHALITSRRTDWRGVARVLRLELMPEEEALQLLTGHPHPQALPAAEFAAAKDLAAELGYLPLALAQAGAYMADTGRTLVDYLRLFRSSRPSDFAADAPSPDYPASYAITWRISIDAAATACPAARPLLELLAFLAPDPLPIEVLGADPAALPENLRSEHARDDAVTALRRYSLIAAEAGAITVHRLVQAVTRDDLDDAAAKAWAETAVCLVARAMPFDTEHPSEWSKVQLLLPHALITTERSEQLETGLKRAVTILNQIALHHRIRAAWGEAEPLLKRAIAITEKTLGPDHPDLATSLNNLALLYRNTGRYTEAEPLYERALAIREKALGPEHPDVAQSLNNLANLYRDTGGYTEAEPLYERAIAILDRSLPPNHPHLAAVRENYAPVLDRLGRSDEAAALRVTAAAIRHRREQAQTAKTRDGDEH
jgi:tetratricopeptide (TPR) repeat protein